jgi:hypothetical protein
MLAPLAAQAHQAPADLRPRLEELAKGGNPAAAYHLGMMHLRGLAGAEKDPAKAFALFKQAAEAGDPLGAYQLGNFYEGQPAGVVEPDAELALKHKLVAAKAGHSIAQNDVAKLFYAKDAADQAAEWLLASAKQGYLPALEALSSLYGGEGKVKKNLGRALAYSMLLQSSSKKKPSERMQQWLKDTRAKLSPAETAEAEDIVKNWRVKPTPLTLEALAGQATARQLVQTAKLDKAAPAPAKAASAEAPAAATPAAGAPVAEAEAASRGQEGPAPAQAAPEPD